MKNYLCIDLGATNIRVGILSEDKKIIKIIKEKSIHDDKEKLYQQIKRLILSLDYQKYDPQAIGISLCGQEDNGLITYAPNLRVTGINLKELLEHDFKLSTKIVNDANAAALAEARLNNLKGTILFTTISSGLGVGLVYNNQLINLPFEAGHQLMSYKNQDYDVETLLSGNGLINLCTINNLKVTNASDFFDLIKNNDSLALKILDDYTTLLAKFYYNQQICYDADYIVLSGGMMKSKSYFYQQLEEKTDLLIKDKPVKKLNFIDAKYDQDAGIYGALAVAMYY